MAITHTITESWSSASGGSISSPVTLTGGVEINLDFQLGATITTQSEPVNVSTAKLLDVYILSTNGSVTIKTSNAAAPADTINITPTNPFVWYSGAGQSSAFTSNFGSWFFTNNGTTTCTVTVRMLHSS